MNKTYIFKHTTLKFEAISRFFNQIKKCFLMSLCTSKKELFFGSFFVL